MIDILTLALSYTGYQNVDFPVKQALIIFNTSFLAGFVGKDEIVQIVGLTDSSTICRAKPFSVLDQFAVCNIPVLIKLSVEGIGSAIETVALDFYLVEKVMQDHICQGTRHCKSR